MRHCKRAPNEVFIARAKSTRTAQRFWIASRIGSPVSPYLLKAAHTDLTLSTPNAVAGPLKLPNRLS